MVFPRLSRWSSVRLPWLMTPQAPLRSRTVGFPESGSDLGSALIFREPVCPRRGRLKRWHASTLFSVVGLPPRPEPQVDRSARLSVRNGLGRRNRRVSRAPLPGAGVTHAGAVSGTASGDVTPPSQLVRAHAPVPSPLSAFGDLMRRVLAGCCHPLLVMGPSRHYPCKPCGGDRTLTPPCPPGASAHFFPGCVGLTSP